jgi:ubiquinol-cytochrome c reductase core subunit 2
LIRETEVYGGLLSSSLSREHIFLTAEFLRGDESVPTMAYASLY